MAAKRSETVSSQAAICTRGNEYKLHQDIFHLYVRNIFCFKVTVVNHWHNLPSDVVESPLLEIFKMWLGKEVDNRIQYSFPKKGWIRWSFKAPSRLSCSVILWSPATSNKKTFTTRSHIIIELRNVSCCKWSIRIVKSNYLLLTGLPNVPDLLNAQLIPASRSFIKTLKS